MNAVTRKIIDLFESLDIEKATQKSHLRLDLGMDSQEVMTLVCMLEKEWQIKFNAGEISRNNYVSDIVTTVYSKIQEKFNWDNYPCHLFEELVIDVGLTKIYAALYDVTLWAELLPHIKKIEMLYTDDVYQEFNMQVDGTDGKLINVRSIRNCQPNEIQFYQPKPPIFLQCHAGYWRFDKISDNKTKVLTAHFWQPNTEGSKENIELQLREHARFALTCWQKILTMENVA